jgi:hypothetical protein
MLEWIISGGVLGGFAGSGLMFSAHEYREAVWGYTGLALLILGVLIAVTGLFIIAANAIRLPQDNAPGSFPAPGASVFPMQAVHAHSSESVFDSARPVLMATSMESATNRARETTPVRLDGASGPQSTQRVTPDGNWGGVTGKG